MEYISERPPVATSGRAVRETSMMMTELDFQETSSREKEQGALLIILSRNVEELEIFTM